MILLLTEVVVIGIGTMIGANIFTLFREISVLLTGYSWLAFLVAGVLSDVLGFLYLLRSKISHTNDALAEYLNYSWNGGFVGGVISL